MYLVLLVDSGTRYILIPDTRYVQVPGGTLLLVEYVPRTGTYGNPFTGTLFEYCTWYSITFLFVLN